MNKDELSLLLYCEARAVDYGGRLHPKQMNDADHANLDKWNASGYVKSGRIVVADHNEDGSLWVWLSPQAFTDAQAERRARAKRIWEQERFTTTAEGRGEERPRYEK